jgi:oligopeptide transport system ATP-binding protein
MAVILQVKDLETQFRTHDGIVRAVNGISYDLAEGETLGIVGESGCGKSVGVLSVMRLIQEPPGRIVGGQILFNGRDLLKLDEEEMRHIRGDQIAMVFQDPMTSLNPVLSISQQMCEALEVHKGMTHAQALARSIELLELVNIPKARDRINDYPHQFSGGMRQRVMIAVALSCSPQILIADEPTTALDVTIQAQIIDIVRRLQRELGMAIIWITHDLGVVAGLADRVIVMYAGHIVETAAVRDLYVNPRHPYTLGLLASLPRLDAKEKTRLKPIDGLPPDLIGMASACPFAPRCTYAIDRCLQENPHLETVGDGHRAACWVDVRNGRP